MAKYQLWGFTYIVEKDGINALNGTMEETEDEIEIPCFNGVAYFSRGDKFYLITYPTIQSLTDVQKETIEDYCGYQPESGEYGVICGALGYCAEVPFEVFLKYASKYQLKKKDWDALEGARYIYINEETGEVVGM